MGAQYHASAVCQLLAHERTHELAEGGKGAVAGWLSGLLRVLHARLNMDMNGVCARVCASVVYMLVFTYEKRNIIPFGESYY